MRCGLIRNKIRKARLEFMGYSGYDVDIDIKIKKVLDSINYVDMKRDDLVIMDII